MKVLHISDIHMKSNDESAFADMIIDSLQKATEQGYELCPDVMVVTGDFTNIAVVSEFENAKTGMLKIKESISSLKECVIVPGNHDYSWKENGEDVPVDRRHLQYKYFTESCKSKKLCGNTVEGVPNSVCVELDKYLISHSFLREENRALLIIGMNSVMLDSAERAGQGYFEKSQHAVCQKLIQHYENRCRSNGMNLIIMAAFHHHVLPVSSVERSTLSHPDKFSLTLDARRTLDFFMDNNVRLAVHGHQHQPSIVCWKDEMRRAGDSVYVISAGSMTQSREDLGDVSRNSYMVYDIGESSVVVYCFQNKEDDWDVMELSREPYELVLADPYADIQCSVVENTHPPKGIVMSELDSSQDTSNLFYLFLSVVDCGQAREEILQFLKEYNNSSTLVQICGIHHLYGKYDILLKYRTNEGDLFARKLREHLKKRKTMLQQGGFYFINVSYENKELKEIHSIPLIKSPDAYLNSTWNMATLTVYLGRCLNAESFMWKLNEKINEFNKEYNTRIEDIIRDYAIGQDQTVLFELFISCYQFPMLTRFTNLIEDIIREYGIDKSTHIVYYFDEYRT